MCAAMTVEKSPINGSNSFHSAKVNVFDKTCSSPPQVYCKKVLCHTSKLSTIQKHIFETNTQLMYITLPQVKKVPKNLPIIYPCTEYLYLHLVLELCIHVGRYSQDSSMKGIVM